MASLQGPHLYCAQSNIVLLRLDVRGYVGLAEGFDKPLNDEFLGLLRDIRTIHRLREDAEHHCHHQQTQP